MPCYTVQETNIDIGKMDARLLADALSDLGYSVTTHAGGRLTFAGHGTQGSWQAGKLQSFGADVDTAALKTAYSTRLVHHQARRAGFKVVKTADKNRFILRRG